MTTSRTNAEANALPQISLILLKTLTRMEDPTRTTQPDQSTGSIHRHPLAHAFASRFISSIPPDDDHTTNTTESNNQMHETGQSSEPAYSEPVHETGLAASIRIIGDSMLRMELAELEVMNQREIARLETERRRSELEDEMTRMMLQTQLQIASIVSQSRSSRKRKRSSTTDSSISSDRDGALVMSLLMCNLI